MDEREAHHAARRTFGNAAMLAEQCRDQRCVNWLDDLLKDLAYGLRLLRRSPAFTAVAVLSLALGIGANTAIFTLVYRTLIERMPVREPERLFTISRRNLEKDNLTSFPHPFFRQLLANNTVFDGLVCRAGGQVAIGDEQQAQMATIEMVSGNFFDVVGVKPLIGRTFTPEDDRIPGGHPVLVLSHNYWVRRFGGDTTVVGRALRVNTHLMTVLGVLPPEFDGLRRHFSPDAYIPVMMQSEAWLTESLLESPGFWWLSMIGRLKPHVSVPQAEDAVLSQLKTFTERHDAGQLETEYRRRVEASTRIELQPAATGFAADKQVSTTLLVLLGLSSIVLLIACTNLTNLLLARNTSRRHEFAIRLSLGASRWRVLRQLTAESLLLAFGGGVLGLLVAFWSGPLLVRLLMGDSPNVTLNVKPDVVLLLFNFGVAGMSAVLFGLGPTWQGIREGVGTGLREGRTVAGSRLFGRKLLLTAQTALSLLLLFGAALFVRSFQSIHAVDLGFRPEQLVQATVVPKNAGYKDQQVLPFFNDLKERLESVPGVRSASFSMLRIMSGNEWGSGITVEGFKPAEDDPGPSREAVGPDYFRTLGVQLLRGREFTRRDDEKSPKVAIVNESFARHYFGAADPIGKRIGPGGGQGRAEYTIVGIVRDTKYSDFRDDARRVWYTPALVGGSMPRTLYVRADGDAERALALVRKTVAGIDRNIPLQDAKSVEMQVAERSRRERMLAMLSTFFAGLAGFLAAIGIYGVMSFSVRQRLREIGIRLALGAAPAQVFSAVIRDVAFYAGLGFALACPAAWYASGLLSDLLYRVEPLDHWSIGAACLAMAVTVLTAGAIPARAASQVEPAATLRAD
jgi:predicted permease